MRYIPKLPLAATILLFLQVLGIAAESSLYFPPAQGEWETVKPSEVGWDQEKLQKALDHAGVNQSSGVVVLYKGRILAEQYWEVQGDLSAKYLQRVIGRDEKGRGIEDVASAQKSVASVLVGIAQQKGLLKIEEPIGRSFSHDIPPSPENVAWPCSYGVFTTRAGPCQAGRAAEKKKTGQLGVTCPP